MKTMRRVILLNVLVSLILQLSSPCEGTDFMNWFGGNKKTEPEKFRLTLNSSDQVGKILTEEELTQNFGYISPKTFSKIFGFTGSIFFGSTGSAPGYLRLYNSESEYLDPQNSEGILSILQKEGVPEDQIFLNGEIAGFIYQLERVRTGIKSTGQLYQIDFVPVVMSQLEPKGCVLFDINLTAVSETYKLTISNAVIAEQFRKKFQGVILTPAMNGIKFIFTKQEIKSQIDVKKIEAILKDYKGKSKYIDSSTTVMFRLLDARGIIINYLDKSPAMTFEYLVHSRSKPMLNESEPAEYTDIMRTIRENFGIQEEFEEDENQSKSRNDQMPDKEEDLGQEDEPQITNLNLDFKALGIGGLDEPLRELVRNAVLSRAASKETLERLDIKEHTKGILLYGPPGTGKTLIAKKISEMLGVKDKYFKVINGPEILSKFLGESEKNIRDLFELAERNPRRLVVLFFDEIDAIASRRTDGGGAGDKVGNNIVNQLLSKMDGVHGINNVLVIGATNRRELIDPALLREGRFSVQLAINLPDEKGRLDIFNIHLKENKDNKVLKGVDVDELVTRSPNFSGAEIKGLCKRARDFSLQDAVTDPKDLSSIDVSKLYITRAHFLAALEQIKPAFGQHVSSLDSALPTRDIFLSSQADFVEHLLARMLIFRSGKVSSILVTGPEGSGKSAIAGCFVDKTKQYFDLTRIIAPNIATKSFADELEQVWLDAQRVQKALIVLDGLEHLLGMLNVFKYDEQAMCLLNTILASKTSNKIVLLITMENKANNLFNQINMVAKWSLKKTVEELNDRDCLEILRGCDIMSKQVIPQLISLLLDKSLSTVLDICKDEKAETNTLSDWQNRLDVW